MRISLTILLLLLFCIDREIRAQENEYRKAGALFQQHRYEDALSAVEEALRLDAKYAPALVLKARLAMVANRFDVARVCLRQAVETAPDSAENWFLLGFVSY